MNLNSYDNVADTLDKSKTWVDVKKKILLSRQIKHRPYVALVKRFNPANEDIDFYIATLNELQEGKGCKPIRIDNYGRVKINVRAIWRESYLNELESDCNIGLECVEAGEDGDIYHLDI